MNKDSFYQDVYSVCKRIPFGKVTTYGLIAHSLGKPYSARSVGWALNQCSKDIPAHRVVNRLGQLSGKNYFDPPNIMDQMLKSEGIIIKNDCIQDFNKVLWVPND